MSAIDLILRDGDFLEYRVEGSTGPDETRAATERITLRARAEGRFEVELTTEEVPAGLYAEAYGTPILVDSGLVTPRGHVFQFRGLCPFLLASAQRVSGASVTWAWDGAGVQAMSDDPDEQIPMRAVVRGPVQWRRWKAWVLERADVPAGVPSPIGYYEAESGVLVGVEYRAEIPGVGRFVYCDAELCASFPSRGG